MRVILALVLALAPIANDICALGCERAQAPSCPLHESQPRPAPDQCGHDHASVRADVARAAHVVPPLVALLAPAQAIGVSPLEPAIAPATTDSLHAPPDRIARTAVLRI